MYLSEMLSPLTFSIYSNAFSSVENTLSIDLLLVSFSFHMTQNFHYFIPK